MASLSGNSGRRGREAGAAWEEEEEATMDGARHLRNLGPLRPSVGDWGHRLLMSRVFFIMSVTNGSRLSRKMVY